MGFFVDEPAVTEADILAEQQLRENKAALEAKRQSLFETRLDIIKGQGAQSWTPNRASGRNVPRANTPELGKMPRRGAISRLPGYIKR